MTMQPFNLALHDHMMAMGAYHERISEYCEDIGDAENGPDLDYQMAHDYYVLRGDSIAYAAYENGIVEQEDIAFIGGREY